MSLYLTKDEQESLNTPLLGLNTPALKPNNIQLFEMYHDLRMQVTGARLDQQAQLARSNELNHELENSHSLFAKLSSVEHSADLASNPASLESLADMLRNLKALLKSVSKHGPGIPGELEIVEISRHVVSQKGSQ